MFSETQKNEISDCEDSPSYAPISVKTTPLSKLGYNIVFPTTMTKDDDKNEKPFMENDLAFRAGKRSSKFISRFNAFYGM